MKVKIVLCITVIIFFFCMLLVICGISGQNIDGMPAFFKIEKNINYRIAGNEVEKIEEEEWNQYIVEIDCQFQTPNSISMSFSENVEHTVIVYSQSGMINGRWLFKKGIHSISLSEKDAKVCISAKEGEEAQLGLTIYGNFNKEKGKYSGKYLSVLGDSISSYEGYISDGLYAGYNDGYDMDVTDMWWYEMARLTGMNICEINASAGSGVTALGDEQFKGNGERCTQLERPGCKPDVIFVLLGINDFFSQVAYDDFKKEYDEMVSKIKTAYPEAELYLCTYFELPGEYKAGVDDLNNIIKEISDEQDVNILDLHGSNLSETEPEKRFVDYNWETKGAVHPNGLGQKILGQWGAELLNKEE